MPKPARIRSLQTFSQSCRREVIVDRDRRKVRGSVVAGA
jgi:hypothetical protein